MKNITRLLVFILVLSFASTMLAKQNKSEMKQCIQEAKVEQKSKHGPTQESTTATLLEYSQKIVQIIKEKNYDKLVKYFSPSGVRFSPYAYVESGHIQLTTKQFLEHIKTNKKLVWGYYDGKGGEIRLSVQDYFDKFVYDVDFVNAPQIKPNKIIGRGNSINNIKKFYPNCKFVEYHFAGFEKQYEGMDWRSLRLIYKKTDDRFCLIGIAHDKWTI